MSVWHTKSRSKFTIPAKFNGFPNTLSVTQRWYSTDDAAQPTTPDVIRFNSNSSGAGVALVLNANDLTDVTNDMTQTNVSDKKQWRFSEQDRYDQLYNFYHVDWCKISVTVRCQQAAAADHLYMYLIPTANDRLASILDWFNGSNKMGADNIAYRAGSFAIHPAAKVKLVKNINANNTDFTFASTSIKISDLLLDNNVDDLSYWTLTSNIVNPSRLINWVVGFVQWDGGDVETTNTLDLRISMKVGVTYTQLKEVTPTAQASSG